MTLARLRLVHDEPPRDLRWWRQQLEDAEDECLMLRRALDTQQPEPVMPWVWGMVCGGSGMWVMMHLGWFMWGIAP